MPPRRGQHVFVSYSSRNAVAVSKILTRLQVWGYHIWLDEYDIDPGSLWRDSIIESLNKAKVVLLIVSNAAIASKMVEWEMETATSAGIKVIPVILEQVKLPKRLKGKLGQYQQVSLTQGRERGLAKLVEALGGVRGLVPRLPDDNKYPAIRRNAQMIAELIRFMQLFTEGGAAILKGGESWEYYIQFLASSEDPEVVCETVGNDNLKKKVRLSREQIALLLQLGWDEPNENSSGNYQRKWQCVADRDRAVAAGEIVNAFLKVYGHMPGDLLGIEVQVD